MGVFRQECSATVSVAWHMKAEVLHVRILQTCGNQLDVGFPSCINMEYLLAKTLVVLQHPTSGLLLGA